MTIAWGDTGRVAYGPLKTFSLTLGTPRENGPSGTPTALPSADPGTAGAQVSYTVQSSDCPTYTNGASFKNCAFVIIAGKNGDAATQSVSWRMFKNGTSVTTASFNNITAGNYWTLTAMFYGVSVGDNLQISAWCTSANVNFDYSAIFVLPSRVNVGKTGVICSNVAYTLTNPTSVLTQGSPLASSNNFWIGFLPSSTSLLATSISQTGTPFTFPALSWHNTFYTGYINNGDGGNGSSSGYGQQSSTKRPLYMTSMCLSSISFREVLR